MSKLPHLQRRELASQPLVDRDGAAARRGVVRGQPRRHRGNPPPKPGQFGVVLDKRTLDRTLGGPGGGGGQRGTIVWGVQCGWQCGQPGDVSTCQLPGCWFWDG